MQRVIIKDAKVVGGVVQVEQDGVYRAATDVQLMSEGATDSSGKCLIGADFAVYIVDTQPDVQLLIDKVTELAEAVRLMTILTVSRSPDQQPFDPAGQLVVEEIIAALGEIELI